MNGEAGRKEACGPPRCLDPQADMLDEVDAGGEDAGRGSKQAKSRLVRVPCFALVELAFFRLNAAADEVPEGKR